ncbi:MAG: alpha/beta hydrolase family protein, partial [Gemmatimonadota bacterium]
CSPVRFHPDGRRVYLVTNRGEDVDLSRLVLLDTRTGETELVESDPEGEVDFGGALFSDRTDELLATTYSGDRRRIYPKTEWFRESLDFLRAELPEGELGFSASTEDESRILVTVSSDVDPGSVYLYDRDEGAVERLYRSRPDLPSEHLASMEAIRYEARDGREIPAYLTLPQGVEHENLPLVVHPHGGPWARDTWGYATYPQFLANRGYAVLQPNFRGSTGYGKDFLNAGNEEWGDAMQDDITDGVRHLIEQGVVDADRVGIYGGSYGGYATLAGLAFTPEVYAAGASYVGPSSILTLLEAIPPYWGPIAEIFAVRVGDLDDPEDRERLRRQSPLFSADAIDDPLLVIQGANDPRVDKRESDQIVVAARENGVDVRYLVAPEEGHGFVREDNRLAVAAALEAFFARHLGGRHQEDASPAVQERLEALGVETDTVSLPDTASDTEADAAATASLPEADGSRLEPTRLAYDITLTAQGQEMDVQASRTLTTGQLEGEDVWIMVEESSTPQGTSTDSLSLDRQRLTPVRRRVSGPFDVDLRYTPDAISGTLSAQGNETSIQTDLEAPVLAGTLNLEIVLAGLPLEEGWETTVRTYAVQQRQVHTYRLEVTGTETVTVPAGETSTFVVEATPVGHGGQQSTYWVRRDGPHHTVRSETQLPPAQGGATVTRELTSVGAPGGS